MTTNNAGSAFNHIVAFDVAKHPVCPHLAWRREPDHSEQAEDDPQAAHRAKAAHAGLNIGPLLVVCEATGGYERPLLEICEELGIAAHKAHGSRVRHFAKYLGLIAKSDPIDARVLALYGLKTENLCLYASLTPELAALIDLRTRRDQIQAMLHAIC